MTTTNPFDDRVDTNVKRALASIPELEATIDALAKEVARLKRVNAGWKETYDAKEAENARLREALEQVLENVDISKSTAQVRRSIDRIEQIAASAALGGNGEAQEKAPVTGRVSRGE